MGVASIDQQSVDMSRKAGSRQTTLWSLPCFLSAIFKGFSQVVLIENTVSGILILAAIAVYSWQLGLIALLSSVVGTLIGAIGGADTPSLKSGLFGYNSILTGMALLLFLSGPIQWWLALAGAGFAALLAAALMHMMKDSGLPILTLPFILITWLFLLASYRFEILQLSPTLVPQDLSHWKLNTVGEISLPKAIFNGIGQIFFLTHVIPGILLYAALFIGKWQAAIYAVIGNLFAVLTAFSLGGEHHLIYLGLYGYNAILTIIAVSIIFKSKENRFAIISGLLAVCATVPVTGTVDTFLLPYGLPALTMPFVLTTGIFLAARKVLPKI